MSVLSSCPVRNAAMRMVCVRMVCVRMVCVRMVWVGGPAAGMTAVSRQWKALLTHGINP